MGWARSSSTALAAPAESPVEVGGLRDHRALVDEAEQRPRQRRGAAQRLGRSAQHRGRRGHLAQLGDRALDPRQRGEPVLEAPAHSRQRGLVLVERLGPAFAQSARSGRADGSAHPRPRIRARASARPRRSPARRGGEVARSAARAGAPWTGLIALMLAPPIGPSARNARRHRRGSRRRACAGCS